MAGVRLDEHILQFKISSRSTATASKPTSDKRSGAQRERKSVTKAEGGGVDGSGEGEPSSKLVVRNLPFQADKKEVTSLFGAFGQLKTVRLPRKFDGKHRGFAFIEYSSKGEAAKAMAALRATHLYGRHLVLQYAEEERSVEAMRERLRSQMAVVESDAAHSAGKSKKGTKGGGKKRGHPGGEDDIDVDL
eukprot:CAMPEP_0174729064 /NCGR_PEP_ID=MMETSP1094-20130205/52951_1 /TAXON_ID=156173 /ORGANISM="Chrysochromulina brevifilum, Strain UTEX LB 985" /LENGTH=189 /DNA_ID=CAMNT_0015931103 /DNA_START=129 /DNA_END=698 /DNA_ORIENTATION=+